MSEQTVVDATVGPVALRDARGRFGQGNLAAVLTGERSAAFWRAQEGACREIVEAVVTDNGFTVADAPRTLVMAAEGLAQSVLIRDSAFRRMVESGGPLTVKGRTRRALAVWQTAVD